MKMMIYFGLLFCGFTNVKNPDIRMNEVRALYQKAVMSENACRKLIEICTTNPQNNQMTLLGYKASATMLMAKHVFNPFTKMSYFKKGKEILEKAIAADEKNIELRFLRFAAQTNMPSFLRYNHSIAEDKKFLLNFFWQIKDTNLKQLMMQVLKKSKYLNIEEKRKLI